MTKIHSSPSRTKDPLAIKIGKRIAQARKMAGFKSAKEFKRKLPKWPENRLSWYEAGYSMPHPNDVTTIAKLTGTSVCWIMFGLGPIRSGERDLQAVRHQNLVYLYQMAADTSQDATAAFIADLHLKPSTVIEHIDNPFKHIGDRLARKIEKAGDKPRTWLDEQHIESDGLCASFPDELRELMTIYSDMDDKQRRQLVGIARTLISH
ncbi:helix-turn-helix domain-containing protein [Thiosocius teredinicola]|uniref:helix-turn-helix domain-containing protein n=1 Tax=Thiosocius teredinicola TaxID=1973002 RepID=UPI0009910DDC